MRLIIEMDIQGIKPEYGVLPVDVARIILGNLAHSGIKRKLWSLVPLDSNMLVPPTPVYITSRWER